MNESGPIWHPGTTLEFARLVQRGTMGAFLGIEFTELGPDYLRATMPVSERTCQPMRVLHGGASVVLAESIASTAANCTVDSTRFALMGQEINANHLRAVRDGEVTATATPVHVGRRTQVWDVRIADGSGRAVCVSRCTLAVVPRPAEGG